MLFKKLRWVIKRHPFLYTTRFRLLSKNTDVDTIKSISYNNWNPKEDIPDCFQEINTKIFDLGKPESDLELIKYLVSWLCQHTKVGPGLSEPSDRTLEIMLYGKGGVCSDMAQVFNNFCVVNDIHVREWGTTCAPFCRDNGGHSFNEVYIKELQKWILIDPSWGGFFKNSQGKLLSVIELFSLGRSQKHVYFETFIPNKEILLQHINKNYLNADITPFLICDYRNKTYDTYLRIARPYVPVFIIHFLIYLSGRSYHYKFPLDDYKNIFS
ncbi:MAG: transglutaminase-like domain-containing protein [Ferruginibacter sp.]